ncbi:MAG: methionine--tRNA ligase [Coriobacteriaceae bacterium]|nr:methionine--tRNA ligase [Coriobacteriaceae bacterium]
MTVTTEQDITGYSYYLTTPIYYVNGVPHLGTAYTTVAADALARFKRMDGKDTWFLTGLDEHGQKVAQSAEANGVSPQEWVDGIAPRFHEAWKMLNISNDDFIRTTEDRHIKGVQQFCETLYENGYLYKDTYEGWYCLPDETFFADDQTVLTDGQRVCPDCGRPVEFVCEENWFFKLSAFEEPLLALYEERPDFICPQTRRNEVVSFVKGGLKDLSISRTTFDWGIPLPFDPSHVIYVWVDALINYITAIGYGSDDPVMQAEFSRRWPAQLHFVGKDIIRFHCVIWPAMLMAAGIEPPQKVFAHGFLLTKGEKMSKSRGNVMTPSELVRIFGVDAYRYYFLSDVQFGADGSISIERMLQVYNADLANSWGNLCSRVFNMTQKYFNGVVPELWPKTIAKLTEEMGNPLANLVQAEEDLYQRYSSTFNQVDYSGALSSVMELCNRANLYVEESAPWNLAKAAAAERIEMEASGLDEADAIAPTANDRLAFVIYNSLEAIRIMALLFAPMMPTTSTEVWKRLGLEEVLCVKDLGFQAKWGLLPAGNRVQTGEPLFPRLQREDIE